MTDEDINELEALEIKHRKEKKELQAQIQSLKKTAKNDKTKKKELLIEITRLELEIDNKHKQELEAVQNKSHVPHNENGVCEIESNVTNVKISKAQKRRDKKSQQDKQRDEEIKQQAKENLHGPRNIETQTITAKLKDRTLKLYPIPSDGDCLYKAVAHQLEMKRDKVITVTQLRNITAEYLRSNKDDFIPFMSNPDTFEKLTDDEFEVYCDKISTTKVWGGQLEIRALSNALKCPINVIQATGPESIQQGAEFDGEPLIITYHRHMYSLGEHYNSTHKSQDLNVNEED